MIAAGIDLGGTKIETQIFNQDWQMVARQRAETPNEYLELVAALANQIAWAETRAGAAIPVGIGAAGLMNPRTGLALTANLCASGKPLPADIQDKAERRITYINDCRALALSEAVLGAGRGHRTVLSLIIGTGVGGGLTIGGNLFEGPSRAGGEFGHTSAPAALIQKHNLPIVTCGCGHDGCAETYIAGPGLVRLAEHLTGQSMPPQEIAAQRAGEMAAVWQLWCELVADLLRNLTLTVDPDVIVIGGGLSKVCGVAEDISVAFRTAWIGDFDVPRVTVADGGDTSGARGAAYAAWQEAQHG